MIAKNGPVIRLRSAIVREKTNLSPQNSEISTSNTTPCRNTLSIQLKLQEKRLITEIPRATHIRQKLGLNKRRKRDD